MRPETAQSVNVTLPPLTEIAQLKRGAVHVSYLDPFNEPGLIDAFVAAGIKLFLPGRYEKLMIWMYLALGWGGGALLNIVLSNYMVSQGNTVSTQMTYTPLWLPLFALVFATLVGLLSGLYPSLRAATLVPVTALKYE